MPVKDAFVCGGAAGAFGSLLTQPLDTIRIRMQTQATAVPSSSISAAAPTSSISGSSTVSWLSAVLRSEGLRGLYRGATAPVIAAGPRSACIFAGYDLALRCRGGTRLSDHFLAGVAGGLVATPVTTPLELVKCKAQAQRGSSAGSVLAMEAKIMHKLWQREGILGLACGLRLTAARDAVFRGFYFATYEGTCRSLVSDPVQLGARPLPVTLLAGSLAGLVAWLPVYPVDVLKTHWQTGRRFDATDSVGLLRRGLAVEGPAWLSRGLAPTLLRSFPLNAIVCTTYEALRAFLQS
eukprot:TRINITY_DN26494_c0_g1_i1.p1 TRINITY_DN26494_c0_g1~~TRINITY_DN26494_c0_g1_i1.p1  ORF type:complete len:294 (+),score=47.06 TRINITY_DN26494_c0_g1_i1:55-936(+)